MVGSDQVMQLTAQFERTWLRPPTGAELSGLIDSFVRDEIYYYLECGGNHRRRILLTAFRFGEIRTCTPASPSMQGCSVHGWDWKRPAN